MVVVFVLLLSLGPFCLVLVPARTMVEGDVGATVAQLARQPVWSRLGFLGEAAIVLAELFMVAALWRLFVAVNGGVALVAAGARAGMAVLQGVALATGLAALSLAEGRGWSAGMSEAQVQQALAPLLSLRHHLASVWQLLFAMHCLTLGWLIHESRFIPPILGFAMGGAGLGYLAGGLGAWLTPGFAARAGTIAAVFALIGETPFFLWLAFKGIDVGAWRALLVASSGAGKRRPEPFP